MGASAAPVEEKSFADIVRSSQAKVGDAAWLQVGQGATRRKTEAFRVCIVGHCKTSSDYIPDLPTLKKWAMHNWSLKGNVKLVYLGGALILFDFETISKAEKALHSGRKMFMGKLPLLGRCSPVVGCLRNGVHLSEIWVRVVGLPMHL